MLTSKPSFTQRPSVPRPTIDQIALMESRRCEETIRKSRIIGKTENGLRRIRSLLLSIIAYSLRPPTDFAPHCLPASTKLMHISTSVKESTS